MEFRGCSIEDCGNKHYGRGWCRTHWKRWWRHGNPLQRLRIANGELVNCLVKACSRPYSTRGYCHIHYLRWKRHGDPLTRLRVANRECSECSVEGCANAYHARGWCDMHYQRWRVHGDPLKVLQEQVPHEGCSVDDCKRPHYGKKMCNIHYYKYVTRPRLRTKYDAQVVDFTPEQWRQTLEYHDYLCAYCGGQADLEQDHVLPISKGGNHTASNIVPACRSCNARKSDSIGKFLPRMVAA